MDERFVGVMGVADQPRAASIATIRRLRGIGIERIVMLTGDSKPAAEAIGRAVGVDEVRAGLLPHDKVEAVRELRHRHGAIAMVGDGVNDAPALAAATVGVAMGGASTAAALETADAALMSDDLSRLPFAIELSRKSTRIIRQNIAIAVSVIVMLIVLAIGGWVQIGPAVVLHEGSTLVVIANALRLLSFGRRGEAIARIEERASGMIAGAPQAALR
jgi:Cd2+/Zn2+-exporting ATPase